MNYEITVSQCRRNRLASLVLVLVALLFSGLSVRAYTPYKTPVMEGTIGKYKVVMQLTFDDDSHNVSGWYYYKSKGMNNKIQLSGTWRPYDVIGRFVTLVEKVNGKVTGTFKCLFGPGNRVTSLDGTWTSSSGKRLSVYLDNQ